ncbi:MAG: HNH endonuclease signature motif containing protein, partial [Oscillospiraceae bacterium]|nr:HNH endonuclease signature motif containing protein [Oscillospiraceae bacterium]
MVSRYIDEAVKRKLYAESMGRCMNPSCQRKLFCKKGDIIEKAHIDPYCETADNSFENLVLLCPNCHTEFDKNHAFTPGEVLEWKKTRKKELERFFSKKYETFEDLKKEVTPILLENKTIYEKYYLNDNKNLWDKFEYKILVNNRKLKAMFLANADLIQHHREKSYSNLAYIQSFISHVDEFEATRTEEDKNREILFPAEINSIFGITPVEDFILPSTESLELLIEKLKEQGKFETTVIGIAHPYIQMNVEGQSVQVFLDDTPRMRQLYYDYGCFMGAKVRLGSLNYALKYIRSRNVRFNFLSDSNLREITIQGTKLIFVYEYCL